MYDETPDEPSAGSSSEPQMPEEIEPPAYEVVTGPLPVCDYTGEPTDEPCEEPATVKRWSGAAVITAASLGAVFGGLLVAAALVWAFGMWPGAKPLNTATTTETATVTKAADINITANANVDAAVPVAAKVTPSVASVGIYQKTQDRFTGVVSITEVGNASGVIIDDQGHILTNNHVVEGADRIVVTLGVKDYDATVVGTDPSTDLAIIKIEGSDAPPIEIGSSADLQVGQFVVAVGSPFGLEKTVTSGIISALGRQTSSSSTSNLTAYTDLIQTDAAINPGNSGGALVDENGKLIGINTLIESPSGQVGATQSAGIGFAIPIDSAMEIANQLIETGKATHPYMGVSTSTIDEATAVQYGLSATAGALVQFVEPGSPAEAGGLLRGDIITKIGEHAITSTEDVFSAIRANKIGDTVKVTVVRADAERTLDVTLSSDASRTSS